MLIAYDESRGQFYWRANLEALDEHMNDIMEFPAEYNSKTTNLDTLFIAGGKSNYITYELIFFMELLGLNFRISGMNQFRKSGNYFHPIVLFEFLMLVIGYMPNGHKIS